MAALAALAPPLARYRGRGRTPTASRASRCGSESAWEQRWRRVAKARVRVSSGFVGSARGRKNALEGSKAGGGSTGAVGAAGRRAKESVDDSRREAWVA